MMTPMQAAAVICSSLLVGASLSCSDPNEPSGEAAPDAHIANDGSSEADAGACPPVGPADPGRVPEHFWGGTIPIRGDVLYPNDGWSLYHPSNLAAGPRGVAWVSHVWYHAPLSAVGYYFLPNGAETPVGNGFGRPTAPWLRVDAYPDAGVEGRILWQPTDFLVVSDHGVSVWEARAMGNWVRTFQGMRVIAVEDDALYLGVAEPGIYRVVLPDGEAEALPGSREMRGAALGVRRQGGGHVVHWMERDEKGNWMNGVGRLEGGRHTGISAIDPEWRLAAAHGSVAWFDRYESLGNSRLLSVDLVTGAKEVTSGARFIGVDERYLYFIAEGQVWRRQHCSGVTQAIGVAASPISTLHDGVVYFALYPDGLLSALPLPAP